MTEAMSNYIKRVTDANELLDGIEEEYPLIEAAQAGDVEARDKIILANIRLVTFVMKQYTNNNVSSEELLQEGTVGLFKAIEKFDTSSQNKFSTYATWWIRQNITRYISNHSRTVKIPIKMSELLSKYNKAYTTLELKHGRDPLPEEVAEYLDVPIEKIEKMLNASQQNLSLNRPISSVESDGRDLTIGDLLEDDQGDVERIATEKEMMKKLSSGFHLLNEEELFVITNIYGFNSNKKMTKIKAAEILGFSNTSHITKIENSALKKLRKHIGENPYN